MGTPFISHLEPTRLDGYDRTRTHEQQPAHIPQTFLDAMAVREAVFVREQGVPLEHEHDADDARSCHWVTYASVNSTTSPELRDPATGAVVRPRRSETRTLPIGTLRVVPFPHPPHPKPGGRYVNNELQEEEGQEGDGKDGNGGATTTTTTAPPSATPTATLATPTTSTPSGAGKALTTVESERQASVLPFGADRPTTYHDGKEPYVKMGRLAVLPAFRGRRIAGQLWQAARAWLEAHPDFFDPSVAELGMDRLKAGDPGDIPKWNGLVCCHAQESTVKLYQRWGFKVDEGMGRWYEEGIPHVGMFLRLNIKMVNPKV